MVFLNDDLQACSLVCVRVFFIFSPIYRSDSLFLKLKCATARNGYLSVVRLRFSPCAAEGGC